jgi:AraC-like DNA-binding protein
MNLMQVFRPTKIRHYVSYMQQVGYGSEAVLAGSGILAEDIATPTLLIDFAQYRTVVANMIALTGNQGLGLEVGADAEISDLGVVGHAIMSSETPRDALGLWLRYSNALVGQVIRLKVDEHSRGSWSLSIAEATPAGFLYNFCVEEFAMMAIRLGSHVTRLDVMPTRIELNYPEPKHSDRYRELFTCPIHFNAPSTRLLFDGISLSHKMRGYDPELNELCVRHCGNVLRQISLDIPLVARIRARLLAKTTAPPALGELATDLGLSERTLRRRLSQEGYSYLDLVRQFRKELAMEYLRVSRLTAKETAHLLGFKDTNAFRRAFRSWTGKTVHQYQDAPEESDGERQLANSTAKWPDTQAQHRRRNSEPTLFQQNKSVERAAECKTSNRKSRASRR